MQKLVCSKNACPSITATGTGRTSSVSPVAPLNLAMHSSPPRQRSLADMRPSQFTVAVINGPRTTAPASALSPREFFERYRAAQVLDYAYRVQQQQQQVWINGDARSSMMFQRHPAAPASLLSYIYTKLQHDAAAAAGSGGFSGAQLPSILPHQLHSFLVAGAAAASVASTAVPLVQHHINHHHIVDEPKPTQSYIGLIAMAILSSVERKLVLSDIYQWILDHYAYFRHRGPGWRNSIRHNLSLNDCFVKAGRSANGKGHYWAIHPANIDDFERGDFRRRRAQRKVRRAMGLSVPDDDDSPSPSPTGFVGVLPPPSCCSWTPSKPFLPPFADRKLLPSLHAGPVDWPRAAASTPRQRDILGDEEDSSSTRDHTVDQSINRDRKVDERTGSGNPTETNILQSTSVKRRLFDMESILAPDAERWNGGSLPGRAARAAVWNARQEDDDGKRSCGSVKDAESLQDSRAMISTTSGANENEAGGVNNRKRSSYSTPFDADAQMSYKRLCYKEDADGVIMSSDDVITSSHTNWYSVTDSSSIGSEIDCTDELTSSVTV